MAIPSGTVIPGAGSFFSFEEGENEFRFLTDFTIAWQGWTVDGKSFLRRPFEDGGCSIDDSEVTSDGQYSKGPRIDYCWIAKVLDFKDAQVKTITMTQKSVMKMIEGWEKNPRGGDVKNWDVSVSKKKEGGFTKYNFQAFPQKTLSAKEAKAIADANLSIEDLFDDKSPAAKQFDDFTDGIPK